MYRVTGNLTHDGQVYAEGDFVELSPEQAQPLLAAGVVVQESEEVEGEEEKTPGETKEPQNEEKKEEEINQAPSDQTSNDPQNNPPQHLESLPYHQLQERAKELGLKHVGVSKNDLIESITTAEAAKKEHETTNTTGNSTTAQDPAQDENLGDNL